jgi:hypothetical protein
MPLGRLNVRINGSFVASCDECVGLLMEEETKDDASSDFPTVKGSSLESDYSGSQ